jgi:hypothetical protein
MNRNLLGLIAVGLLLLGGGIVLRGDWSGNSLGFAGGCIRVGLVLGALWLALPQVQAFFAKTPRWLLIASAIGLVGVVIKPMLLLIAIPLLGALWFLAPKLVSKADKMVIQGPRPKRRRQS